MEKFTTILLSALLLASSASLPAAELKPASLFTDHMILQREQPVPVWGREDPGEEVIVQFAGQKKTAKADADGKWMVKLDPMPASAEPRELTVSSANPKSKIQNFKFTDVLVGDIWLCSGQSNMGMGVGDSANAAQEIASANYPEIRYFSVAQNPALAPADAVKGEWRQCSPETAAKFSGAAYFFGRELYKELKIPIGLLHSSVGGTPAEAWTRMEALKSLPALAERAKKEIAQIQSQEEDNKRFPAARAAWEEKYGVKPPPVSESARGWADPELDVSDWKTVTLPSQWGNLGEKSGGVFWLRKEVDLPESAAGKPFSLGLNWVSEQYETAYFNGVEVGRASDKAPDFYMLQRRCNVPGNLVKAGRNVLAVRVVSATERSGLWQWGRHLGFPVADAGTVDNQWLMKAESHFAPLPKEALASRPKPNNVAGRSVSSSLYNGMIAPLVPFAIKGAIWYQGESNAGRHAEYRDLLTTMIRDWRAQWGSEFAFHIQQLVNNSEPPKDANQRTNWSYLREAQVQLADTVPKCGIAVGIELGEAFSIHPKNKQDVGKRLALVALEKTYGRKIESSGPRYDSMKVEGGAIRVKFTHAAGLHAKAGPLQRFAIAGADKKFVWADAKIDPSTSSGLAGDSVVVSSPQVPQPVAVRYAWANNPDGCNLYNSAGLSASPFRTDDWPAN
jgi:sialate O-acetylesterase